MNDGFPPAQGLYDPRNEHDSCGVGFVVDIHGRKSHAIVRQGLAKLWSMQTIGRYTSLRMRGGNVTAGLPNVAKLSMSEMLRLHRDVATRIIEHVEKIKKP